MQVDPDVTVTRHGNKTVTKIKVVGQILFEISLVRQGDLEERKSAIIGCYCQGLCYIKVGQGVQGQLSRGNAQDEPHYAEDKAEWGTDRFHQHNIQEGWRMMCNIHEVLTDRLTRSVEVMTKSVAGTWGGDASSRSDGNLIVNPTTSDLKYWCW